MAAPQLDEFERLSNEMSDQSDHMQDDFGGDDILAAELSLGLLSGDTLVQTERRARIDQHFAGLVEAWDIRLAQLTEDIAPVEPPKGLFRKIANEAYPESPKRIWQTLGILPALLGAGAAALVLILALNFGSVLQGPSQTPSFAARMAAEDESLIVAAAFIEETGTLQVTWEVGERLPDRDVELWLIAGDNPPVSVGVLNKGTPLSEFTLAADLRDQLAGGVFAVSDEPLGGSPTGAPTGAVLAVGEVTTL